MEDTLKHTPAALEQTGLENYIPYLMNRIISRYNKGLRDEITALGLTTAKMRIIATLKVKKRLPISMLSVYAVIEQSTLSRALEGLERDRLVMRKACENDQRSYQISLTDQGMAVYDRLWPHMAAGLEAMFVGIPHHEQEAFLDTLHKILANIRKHDF